MVSEPSWVFSYPLQESLTVEWESHSQVGAMENEGKLRVYRFNGQNFQLWKMQMEDYLYQKDLWKPLEGKTKNQGSMSNDESDLLDKKALRSIRLCLAPIVAFNITKAMMTEELMQTLARLYEKPSSLNKVFLMKHLFNMKMVKG